MKVSSPIFFLFLAFITAITTPGQALGDTIIPVSGSTSSQIGFGSIANVIDGVLNYDSYLRLGPPDYTAFQGPYSVTFDLGGQHNLTSLNLWNNAGFIEFDGEGIDSFTLRFLNSSFVELGTFSDNAVDTLSGQTFSLTANNVSHVDLVINSNHDAVGRAYADFYEINFTGTAVPEPSSLVLVGIGLFAAMHYPSSRRRKLRSGLARPA